MKLHARISLSALLCCAIVGLAPAAAQAASEFSVEKFVAINCNSSHATCAEEIFGPFGETKEVTEKGEAEEVGFTQAGGHVPNGVTDFKVATFEEGEPSNRPGALNKQVPLGVVKHIRTDVAPGLATSPDSTPQCSGEDFGETEAVPGTGFYAEPKCPAGSKVGENFVTVYAGSAVKDLPLSGNVYNLEQENGVALEFGIALKLPKEFTEAVLHKAFEEEEHPLENPALEKLIEEGQYFAHTIIDGNVEWGKEEAGTNQGDYHDYFTINVSPALPLIRSRLIFFGTSGEGENGYLITNGTNCPGSTTSRLVLTDTEGDSASKPYTTPIGLSGCDKVPFEPLFALDPATTGNDQPDGFTANVGLTHHLRKEDIDSSQLKTAVVKLPEGMTLNPSAAAGLEACTPAQARIHSSTPGTSCPAGSKLGTVTLNVPQLPAGSLSGNLYVGGPETGPITGQPFTMYLDAESERYGVSVRVRAEVFLNEITGQVTTVFPENPEQPFSEAILHFKGGALAPIANPLICGSTSAEGSFAPYTGTPARTLDSPFTIDADGKGGACSSPLPFSPKQATGDQSPAAGGKTSFAFTLERPEGSQYLKGISTTLPEGLLGLIPTAEQCAEAQANAGTCPGGSAIGSVEAYAGSGPTPYRFPGTAYLTGPYKGAPFGMSVVVPEVAGPFDFGLSVTRATINVNHETTRVTVASEPPLVVKPGIILRLQRLVVNIDRQGFLINPTSCAAMQTESTLTGVQGTNVTLSSPFQVQNCNSLPFKPTYRVVASARSTKKNGTSLETTLNLPTGSSNVKSVLVTLPVQLPSRISTLDKACLVATFNANPYDCPGGSFVGGVRANTPTLKDKMKGPAILVSHKNAAFPDLDLVLEADGVKVIVKGTTHISKGITTTNFENTPDAPVSSITVNLPNGSHSIVTGYGDLCRKPLYMPTVITGQNGGVYKKKTRIKVNDCNVKIVRKRVIGNAVFVTVKAFEAGRVSGTGPNLRPVYRHLRHAGMTTIKVPLSRRGRSRGRPFRLRLRIGFLPRNRRARTSVANSTLFFR
jgi:hypothetical protein